jgi:hypothetical protein
VQEILYFGVLEGSIAAVGVTSSSRQLDFIA